MSDDVVIPSGLASAYEEWVQAREARLRWETMEKSLKSKLVDFLFDPDDPKPQSVNAVAPDGRQVFHVAVSYRRGPDIRYLKTAHPDVYAECEKVSCVKTIKGPPDEPQDV